MTAFFNTGLTQQQFLEQYWQKKPLLIRQAFPNFTSPISPDEFAGLALEEDVESRLIEESSHDGPWRLRHGPFIEDDFSALPKTHWTLLIQDMDKHLPELRELVTPFEFIPDWRRDDLMISFAPEGGSVGPHTDGYDVFLLQGLGTRRWEISEQPVVDAELIEGLDLKILREFSAYESWDLQPGDLLYLPPHFAHYGVALNNCMTFSVGFRAPKQAEVLDAFIHTLLENELGQQHYADPDLFLLDSATEIDAASKQRFKEMLKRLVDESDAVLSEALGRLLTETKPSLELHANDFLADPCSLEEIASRLEQGEILIRNRYLRFCWTESNEQLQLFVAGEMLSATQEVRPVMGLLTSAEQIDHQAWLEMNRYLEAPTLVESLINLGAWYWE